MSNNLLKISPQEEQRTTQKLLQVYNTGTPGTRYTGFYCFASQILTCIQL